MIKRASLVLAAFLGCATGMWTQAAAANADNADDRTVWEHSRGSFSHVRGKQWLETWGPNRHDWFEQGRTKEFIQLYDPKRKATIRLYDDRCLIARVSRPGVVEKIYDGKWRTPAIAAQPAGGANPPAGVSGDSRVHWAHRAGYFKQISGKKWQEGWLSKRHDWFEQARTTDYIELYDSNRRDTLRLYSDRAELSKDQGRTFRKHYDGKWQAASVATNKGPAAKPPPKSSGSGKVEGPDRFAGNWRHEDQYRTDLTISRSSDDWKVELRYYDSSGKELGRAHGERIRLSNGVLFFSKVFDVRPAATWRDAQQAARFDRFDSKGRLLVMTVGALKPDGARFERIGDAPQPGENSPPTGGQPASGETSGLAPIIAVPHKPTPGDASTAVGNLAALSPRGDYWALYRRKAEVELRSCPDDRLVAKLPVNDHVTFLAFSADGKTLAVSTMSDANRRLGDTRPKPAETAFFDVATHQRRALIDHAGLIVGELKAAISPQGKYFAATTRVDAKDARMYVWSIDTGQKLLDYDDPGRDSGRVAFSADGKKLAIAGSPIMVIEIGSGKRRAMEKPAMKINHMAISPDGKLLALGGAGGEIAVIDTATGKTGGQFRAYPHSAGPLEFTTGGKLLLTASPAENAIRAYDAQKKLVAKIPTPKSLYALEIDATADGRYVLGRLFGVKKAITIWKTPWGETTR